MTARAGASLLPPWASGAEVVAPGDLAAAREAVAGPGTLLFTGAGTKLDWGARPERVDRVVSTGRLDRLLAHDPGDLTATVQAGMPLLALQEALAPSGQWLALDPPSAAAGATIGGLFATGEAGPGRLRFGTLRDLVIGTTAVLADGAVSRSGGRVIKNVAGYDLAKLLCGSLGTLALVVETTVRLHPLPAASATLQATADAAAATRVTLAMLASPLEPVALEWVGAAGVEGSLLVRFEGRADGVDAQARGATGLAHRHGVGEVQRLEGGAEAAAWAGAAARDGETVVRAATLPSQFADAAGALSEAVADAASSAPTGPGETVVAARLHSHTGLGLHDAVLSGGGSPRHARVVERWRAAVGARGGSVVVRRHPPELESEVDVWGSPPGALTLMRSVKQRFDPQRRCAPGRFVGGL